MGFTGAATSNRAQASCMVTCNQAIWETSFVCGFQFPEGHDLRLQGYIHGVSGIFIQGMPCISQLISHKVLSEVF